MSAPYCTAQIHPCPMRAITLDAHAAWMLLRFALYYSLWRKWYDVSDLCALVASVAPQLVPDQRRMLAADIRQGLARPLESWEIGEYAPPQKYRDALAALATELED